MNLIGVLITIALELGSGTEQHPSGYVPLDVWTEKSDRSRL